MQALRLNLAHAEAHQADLSLYLQETLSRQATLQKELDNTQLERQRLVSDLADLRARLDPTVRDLEATRRHIADLEQRLQEVMADNGRLEATNQTNLSMLEDARTQLQTTDRSYTTLKDEHLLLQGNFREADKQARHAIHKYQKLREHFEKCQTDSDRRDRMLARLRRSKHALREQLRDRIRLLLHTLDLQTRQSTRYSRQLDAIQKAYPQVTIPSPDDEEEEEE